MARAAPAVPPPRVDAPAADPHGHAAPPPAPGRAARGESRALLAVAVVTTVVVALLAAVGAAPVARLDKLLYDNVLRATASGEPARRTIVVDIDDPSLDAVGQWPWPRYRIAALIERIAAARPKAIALDILFPEADRTSLAEIRRAFKRDFDVDVAFGGVPDGLLDNDGWLGEQIARGDVVASNYFYFDHGGGAAPPPGLAFTGRIDRLRPESASGVLVNAPPIAARTRTTGFVNHRLDDDGVLRRLPLLIEHRGALHPSLALAAAMRATGADGGVVEAGVDGAALRFGERRIALGNDASALLRFAGPPSLYAALPAVDVLAGRYTDADFAGRIVFIGTSAVGLNDHHDTAVARRFPGLKIQAAMAENLLAGNVVAVPAWAPAAALAACVVVGVALTALATAVGGVGALVAGSAGAGAAVVAASAAGFVASGRWVSPAAPLLLALLLFVTFAATRYALERRRSRRAQRQLENARQVTIEAMASVAETRDPETGAHIKRTQHYVRAIAEELRRCGEHADMLTPETIELMFLSAPLHDIGKVGVPDHILLKPGPLTAAEREQMKLHAEFGRRIVISTAERIDGDNFLRIAADIAATHHEKWDGSGYPRGLAGDDIPLAGRIMAVADVYDALISRRCYKAPMPHEHALATMRRDRGRAYDPQVFDAFVRIEATVLAIAARYRDPDEDLEPPQRLSGRPALSASRLRADVQGAVERG